MLPPNPIQLLDPADIALAVGVVVGIVAVVVIACWLLQRDSDRRWGK